MLCNLAISFRLAVHIGWQWMWFVQCVLYSHIDSNYAVVKQFFTNEKGIKYKQIKFSDYTFVVSNQK